MIPRHLGRQRRYPKREPTMLRVFLETVARILLHEDSQCQLSEEEYLHWFLGQLFTLECFFELIAFTILCFWSGGGLLFFSLVFFHVFNGFMNK